MYLQMETRLVIKSKMYIQVKRLGYPSKQEGNDWNQRKRQDRLSNATEVQFFMCTFWTHISFCFSHQKFKRRTPNPIILHESVVWTSENGKSSSQRSLIILKTNLEIQDISLNCQPEIINAITVRKTIAWLHLALQAFFGHDIGREICFKA